MTAASDNAAGFLRNNYRAKEPLAVAFHSQSQRRIANILMDCEGYGIRIVKDLSRQGRGWKWIWDPLPGTDTAIDTGHPDRTLFMIYGATTETGGAYVSYEDLVTALGTSLSYTVNTHTSLAFSSPAGNTSDKEANTDHDYRYPILGNTYTDAFFRSIGSVAAANTKTSATPAFAVDLAGYRLKTGTGSPAKWGSTPRFICDDTTEASSTDGALQVAGGVLVSKKVYVADTSATSISTQGGIAAKASSSWDDGSSAVKCTLSPGGSQAATFEGAGSRSVKLCTGSYAIDIPAGDVVLTDGFLILTDGGVTVGTNQIIGGQEAAVADASGGVIVDAEARTAINTLLARLRSHGLIAI